jgi:hypothetical protein
MSGGKRSLAAKVLFSGRQSFIGPEMNREPFRKVDYYEWKGEGKGVESDIKLRKKN